MIRFILPTIVTDHPPCSSSFLDLTSPPPRKRKTSKGNNEAGRVDALGDIKQYHIYIKRERGKREREKREREWVRERVSERGREKRERERKEREREKRERERTYVGGGNSGNQAIFAKWFKIHIVISISVIKGVITYIISHYKHPIQSRPSYQSSTLEWSSQRSEAKAREERVILHRLYLGTREYIRFIYYMKRVLGSTIKIPLTILLL